MLHHHKSVKIASMTKQKNTGRTHFKPGHSPAHKGKKLVKLIGNTNGFKKGMIPWNKGKKIEVPVHHEGQFKKGHTPWHKGKKTGIVPKSAFQAGHEPWHKGSTGVVKVWNTGKKCPELQGENNGLWKGDNVSYSGIHNWVYRKLGKPDTCEHCGKSGLKGRQIHWANKSQKYLREISDWIRLCGKCHKKYDEDYTKATGIRASRLRMSHQSPQ